MQASPRPILFRPEPLFHFGKKRGTLGSFRKQWQKKELRQY
jgi:hypothetical protein